MRKFKRGDVVHLKHKVSYVWEGITPKHEGVIMGNGYDEGPQLVKFTEVKSAQLVFPKDLEHVNIGVCDE